MVNHMASFTAEKLERKIGLARLALGFERIWAALLWPLLIFAVFLILVFSGLLPGLPSLTRYAIIAILILAYAWSLRPLSRVAWPSRMAAMRRIEQVSALEHRPVSALDDVMAEDSAGDSAQAIWQEHKFRQIRLLDQVRIGKPQSRWRDLDAMALRVPVGMALIASLILGAGDPRANLADSLRIAPLMQAAPIIVDAWLKPPAYTGKPPVMLTSPAMVERLKTEPDILVPENSTLILRVAGADAPELKFFELSDAAGTGVELKDLKPAKTRREDAYQSETKITRPALASLTDGGRGLLHWRIAVIPDAPPVIAFTADPKSDASGALTVKWNASDDYGVTAISSSISLSDIQDGGIGFSGNGVFLFDPPKFPIALRHASPKQEDGATSADLTAHPWAGLMVEMVLEAHDAADHATPSETRTFRLPERIFVKPLAQVLIEQRKQLIMDPDTAPDVSRTLNAVLAYPQDLIESSGPHIAIAAVISRLDNAASTEDVGQAIDMLWHIAVNVEDGALAGVKAELESLRQQLEKALADGASPELIQELMTKLRGAMDRYMQSMLEETQKRLQQGGGNQQQPQLGQKISPQDLRKLLDMIDKLAKSGANDAARQMLSELDKILRNLDPGAASKQQSQQGDSAMAQMLDQLSELMRKQQGLMDDTQRLSQPGENDSQDENNQQSGGGQPQSPGDLAGRQQDLSKLLDQLMLQLGKQGLQGPPALGEAGRQMRGAEGSLRQQDRDGALGQQGEAINKLREGAQGMVKQMIQQGQGQQGSAGEHGEARGDDRDPLGRPMPNRSEDYGPDRNMLPSELALRRAQEILDALRARANVPELPRIERDYIDRLLRGLY